MSSKSEFNLRSLLTPLHLWLLAWGLGVAVAVSVLGLLIVSGYFLAAAGLAMSVNYVAISGLIRNFALIRTVGRYGDLMVSHYAIFGLLQKLRVQFFDKFAQLPIGERLYIGSATAQHRLVKDIDTLNEFPLRVVTPFVVVGVVLLATSLALGYVNGVFLLLLLPLPIVILYMLRIKKIVQRSTDLQEIRQNRLVNALPALTQLGLWGKWQGVMGEIGHLDNELSKIHAKQSFLNTILTLGVQAILAMFLLLVINTVGGALLHASDTAWVIPIGLAVVFGFFGLMEVVAMLTADIGAFARASLAKDRLNALVGSQTPQNLSPMPDNFNIKINNLSAYQIGAVFGLDDVNAVIKQGVPFVIMGASGAGKSTLLQTLAGELSPKAGEIILETNSANLPINGIDWQGNLGFLGQQVDIFDQSLADNLKLGKQGASDDELWAVLDLVGLKAWAGEQPQGLHTPLGEYGVGISGGQARRIALARLLLSPKKVLLLDEPFAGLDRPNRQRLWEVLKARQADGILVVVSHHDEIVSDGVKLLKVG